MQLQKALEKAEEQLRLEGFPNPPDWRRQTPIFKGQKNLGKGSGGECSRGQRSLSRGKTGPRVDVEASKAALEKAREELQSKMEAKLPKPEPSQADQALQPKTKPKTKARPKFKEEPKEEPLEKDTPGSGSAEPSLESLEKEAWAKKVAAQAKEFAKAKKAKVYLD